MAGASARADITTTVGGIEQEQESAGVALVPSDDPEKTRASEKTDRLHHRKVSTMITNTKSKLSTADIFFPMSSIIFLRRAHWRARGLACALEASGWRGGPGLRHEKSYNRQRLD